MIFNKEQPSSENDFELDLVKRYEDSIKNNESIYLDIDEIISILNYYIYYDKNKELDNLLAYGKKLHSSNPMYNFTYAKRLFFQEEYKKALEYINEIEKTETIDGEVLFIKASCLMHISIENYKNVPTFFGIDTDNDLALEALSILNKLVAQETVEDIESLCIDIARLLMECYKYRHAVVYYNKAIEKNPNVDLYYYEKALCCETILEFDEAIKCYNKLLDKNPYYEDIWYNIGEVYYNKRDYEKAIEAFDYVTVINEKEYNGWFKKGLIYFAIRSFEKSIEMMNMCIKIDPKRNDHQLYIGSSYSEMGEYEEAIKHFKLSLEMNDRNLSAIIGIADSYMRNDKFKLAEPYLKKAVKLSPEDPLINYLMGECYFELNKLDKAYEALNKSVKLDPTNPDAWFYLGNLYFDLEKFDKALKCYRNVVKYEEDYRGISMLLAVCYFKTGKMMKGKQYTKKAYQESPLTISFFNEYYPEALIYLKEIEEKKYKNKGKE